MTARPRGSARKPAGRRRNGDGHYRRRPDGRLEQQITVKDRGASKRVSVYGRTETELNENIEAMRAELYSGKLPLRVGRDRTFAQLSDEWLNSVRRLAEQGKRSAGTWGHYEGLMRLHAVPIIGKVPLRQLDVGGVRAVLDVAREHHLSPQTVRHLYSAMRAALHFAKRAGYVSEVVTADIENDEVRVRAYRQFKIELDDARAFVDAASACHYGTVFRVGFPLLLREGEVLGLRWRDVDLKRGKIIVRAQLDEIPTKLRPPGWLADGRVIVERTKTDDPEDEEMDLGPVLTAVMREHQRRQLLQRSDWITAGRAWRERIPVMEEGRLGTIRLDDNDLAFTTPNGNPISPKVLTRHFHSICAAVGIRYSTSEQHGARIHDLRGSCAVLLLTEESAPGIYMSPRAVMKRGRWKSWQVFQHYTEVQEKTLAKVAMATERLLFGT